MQQLVATANYFISIPRDYIFDSQNATGITSKKVYVSDKYIHKLVFEVKKICLNHIVISN